ncbi:hypothetical protein FQN50_003984 [Emmonsiellopsis sp. PD_5]|nr:hypothetical protein FQN50_003984 [Emmonsiellopsis sp. PD_5]
MLVSTSLRNRIIWPEVRDSLGNEPIQEVHTTEYDMAIDEDGHAIVPMLVFMQWELENPIGFRTRRRIRKFCSRPDNSNIIIMFLSNEEPPTVDDELGGLRALANLWNCCVSHSFVDRLASFKSGYPEVATFPTTRDFMSSIYNRLSSIYRRIAVQHPHYLDNAFEQFCRTHSPDGIPLIDHITRGPDCQVEKTLRALNMVLPSFMYLSRAIRTPRGRDTFYRFEEAFTCTTLIRGMTRFCFLTYNASGEPVSS